MSSNWRAAVLSVAYLAASVAHLHYGQTAAGSVALIASFLFGCTAVARGRKT